MEVTAWRPRSSARRSLARSCAPPTSAGPRCSSAGRRDRRPDPRLRRGAHDRGPRPRCRPPRPGDRLPGASSHRPTRRGARRRGWPPGSWRPPSRHWSSSPSTMPIPSASRAAYGSSRSTSRGWPSRQPSQGQPPAHARREAPDPRVALGRPGPTRSSAAAIRSSRSGRGTPPRSAAKRRFSVAVRSSYRPVAWGRTATRRRTSSGRCATSIPSTKADPKEGRSDVARTRSRVVLPAPLGPNTAIARPGWTRSVTPARAGLRRNRRARSRVSAAGVVSSGTPVGRT